MNVLIGSPYMQDMRGNSITANRIMRSLKAHSIDVTAIDYYDPEEVAIFSQDIKRYDVFHILNPVRYLSSSAFEIGYHERLPYGITFTGTDVNCHLDRGNRKLMNILLQASFITVFHEQSLEVVLHTFPELQGRVHVIAQGFFAYETKHTNLTGKETHMFRLINSYKEQGYAVMILPAGIRKVKRVPWAIEMFGRFNEKFPHKVFLYIVGPTIEERERQRVEQLVKETKCVAYFPEMKHMTVLRAIEQADILLNCSESEGQSLAIIEAFQLRTPVIASDVPGNAQMIQHGGNGLLFTNEQEFQHSLLTILEQKQYAARLAQKAYEKVKDFYSADAEARRLIPLYQYSVEKNKTSSCKYKIGSRI